MEDEQRDRWAVPPTCFDDLGEKERAALEAHIAMRIQQIKDGTIPFRNFITLEQLEQMGGRGSTSAG